MNINPYILLGLGLFFALLYACSIIFVRAITLRNRRKIQEERGISKVSTWILDSATENAPQEVKTISLAHNHFLDTAGKPVDVQSFISCIAVGESSKYPGIHDGDLVLKDKGGNVCHVFSVPNLKDYQ